MHASIRRFCVCLLIWMGLSSLIPNSLGANEPPSQATATVFVAAHDSSELARKTADFLADGESDQFEINAALETLPSAGGTVMLAEGTYDIRKTPGTLGGIIISKSNVTLAGRGPATVLRLAPDQNTNVVRILGNGVHHVEVRDLKIDANRSENSNGQGDPNISHDRFEFCGIKAYCREPRGPGAMDLHHITVRNCEVRNAHRLGIMMEGKNLQVLNNILGNAGSDSVELLTGPGIIQGNYVEITEQTHVAIGTDRANGIQVSNNIVHVQEGGKLDIGFRTWANSQSHVIQGNTLIVEPKGICSLAMDLRGQMQTVQSNSLQNLNLDNPITVRVGGGNTSLGGNLFQNVSLEIDDQYPGSLPIRLNGNVFSNATVRHKRGRIVGDVNELETKTDHGIPVIRHRFRVDRSTDIGQSFGSIFEATSDDSQFTMGAGFLNAYNTRLRADRHILHFYVRDNRSPSDYLTIALPRPNDLCGTYLYSRDDQIYSTYGGQKQWNDSANQWRPIADLGGTSETMRVGNGLLKFGESTVSYNDRTILPTPDRGAYQMFFYANGYLCFYHVERGDRAYRPYNNDQDGFSRLLACPWTPNEDCVDMSRALMMNLPIVGETTFAWGVWDKQILTGSNIGGFYVLSDGKWIVLRQPDLKTSFQLYSSLAFDDHLYMGQYPTGRLFAYNGQKLSEIPNWPPIPEGFSTQAREAQTTSIYGGELIVGVWPWGELWRMNPGDQKWSLARRMFDHPHPNPHLVHPYDNENRGNPIPNLWGQRITSLIPLRNDLFVSTSAKAPVPWEEDRYSFLAPDLWKSYGQVYRISSSGNLSVPTSWTEGPTTLEFTITSSEMTIDQDGVRIGWRPLTGMDTQRWSRQTFSKERIGQGIYGKTSAKIEKQ